jgi:hypothetical protein
LNKGVSKQPTTEGKNSVESVESKLAFTACLVDKTIGQGWFKFKEVLATVD